MRNVLVVNEEGCCLTFLRVGKNEVQVQFQGQPLLSRRVGTEYLLRRLISSTKDPEPMYFRSGLVIEPFYRMNDGLKVVIFTFHKTGPSCDCNKAVVVQDDLIQELYHIEPSLLP